MRAFTYSRVSTNDQQYSPEVQRQQAEAFATLRQAEIVDVLDDTGVSGKVPFAERPAGAQLLARIDEVDMVIFAKLDRAFRNTVDCILTVARLQDLGKAVVFLDLGIDTSTPAGRLCMTMFAGLAEFERGRIAERTTEAMAVAQQRGVKIGPAPFGYDNVVEFDGSGERVNRGRHRPRSGEYEVVQEVVELFRDHAWTPTRIAEKLNSDCVPTRQGGEWSSQHVIRMLKREQAYA